MVARTEKMEAKIDWVKDKANTHFDPNVSVIISGIHYEKGENVMGLVKDMLTEGLILRSGGS